MSNWIMSLLLLCIWLYSATCQESAPPPIAEVPLGIWEDQITVWQITVLDKPDLQINNAWLTIKSLILDSTLSLYTQHEQCFGCDVQLQRLILPNGNTSQLIQTEYGNHVEIRQSSQTLCRSLVPRLRERGDYWLILFKDNQSTQNVTCNLVLANDPPNQNLAILYAFLVFLGMAIIWIIIKKLYAHGKCRCPSGRYQTHDFTSSTTVLEMANSVSTVNHPGEKETPNGTAQKPQASPTTPADTPRKVKQRLKSLDAFRGFSLIVMIFVNYGGGSYWFFQHAHWDGLLVADLVMPWFVWIMGTSITFSFRGMLKRGTPKWRIFLKILERSIKIFAIGLFMNGRTTPDMKTLRIPNVLQRLAFTYFITALVHLGFATADGKAKIKSCRSSCARLRDILDYWPEWIIMFAILGLYCGLTYGLPISGCPTGYTGPGGLHEGGKYFNCTAGAAAVIDEWILGGHIYMWPTIRAVYQTGSGYEPEGILGTLTSIFMCFLGLQAGKIISTYKSPKSRIIRWLMWGIVTAGIGIGLCEAKMTGGLIAINKNLWSVSFILVLCGMAYFVLTCMYLIIDVAHFWSGAPFTYPGMNSIVIYVCHTVFGSYFPLAWQWPDNTYHWPRLFRALWGSTIWTITAFIMYMKKIFVAL